MVTCLQKQILWHSQAESHRPSARQQANSMTLVTDWYHESNMEPEIETAAAIAAAESLGDRPITVWECGPGATAEGGWDVGFRGRGSNVEFRNLPSFREPLVSRGEDELHIITGGMLSVNAEGEWMEGALEVVEELLGTAEKGVGYVLGVCLGSQMIAHCLSPGSIRASHILQVGARNATWRGGRGPSTIPAFHYEAIDRDTLLTCPGVQIEAWAEDTEVVAFSYGERIAGIQWHPEFSRAILEEVFEEHRELIESHGQSVEDERVRLDSLMPVTQGDQTQLVPVLRRLLPTYFRD